MMTKKTALLFFAYFLSAAMNAQISGTVTVNSGLATAGSNYQTFTDLANTLNANGINGPLTVNVVNNSGPYNEQIVFNQINGASSSNRIVINGNNNLLTFNGTNSSVPYIIGMNGADYFTFNNLNVQGTGTYAYCAMLYNGANYNLFSACSFSVPYNTTSSNQIPVVFSGSGTSYATSGNSGNYNTFAGCTMYSGYAGVWMYGLTSSPFNSGNTIQNCTISDFYYYGIYAYYSRNLTFRYNILERLTRTTSTTTYGTMFGYNSGLMCDGNQFRRFFEANQTSTSACYPIYGYYAPTANSQEINVIRNNMVYDMKHNGTIYGVYYYYLNGNIYNNTISLDYPNATGGSTYGMYTYGGTGYPVDLKNNIVSLTRGGTGTKYGLYIAVSGNITSDRNDIYVNSTSGGTNTAYYNGAWASLASYQTTGLDLTSYSVDPLFSSITNSLYPTNATINNQGIPLGILYDANMAIRNSATPDLGALEFLTPNCSGTPTVASVSQPTYQICSGEDAMLGLSSLSANNGMTYQWGVSTISSAGPFLPIQNANGPFYTAPTVTANSYYQVVQTCTLPGGGSVNAVGSLTVAGTTTNTVPYLETFEGIGRNDRLPNCSWSSVYPRTFTTSMSGGRYAYSGTGYASFDPADGPNYYYTNGIYLFSGVVYSTSCRYRSELNPALTNNGWSPLSILLSTSQSVSPTNTIASTNGSITAGPYAILSNTFMVTSSGLYYVSVQANPSAINAPFLTIDDLSVTAPCFLGNNTPNMSPGTFTSFTLCTGQTKSLSVSGASSYSWSLGSGNSAAFVYTANIAGINPISVTGINTLTGCFSILNQTATVYNPPVLNISSTSNSVCIGSSLQLNAFGAATYTWNTGQQFSSIVISPSVPATFSVIGTSSLGCSSSASINISILSTPTISLNSLSNFTVCLGQGLSITASGANTYTWNQLSNGSVFSYSPLIAGTQTLTVVGTNTSTGCLSQQVVRPVSVYALPAVSITGTNAVCSGSPLSLTANGASTYTWLNTGSNGASLVVSPTSMTTYSLLGSNSQGCTGNIATQLVTINSLPNISITGTNTVCSGSSFMLIANGAPSYTWLNTGSNASSLNASLTANTTYTLLGMSPLGCIGSPATLAVSVYSLPVVTITGANTVCTGNSVTLTAGGANSYTWINTGSNVGNIVASPLSAISYSLIGSNSQGCQGNMAIQTITVLTSPILGLSSSASSLCALSTATLSASGANTYSWSTNASASTIAVTPSANAVYNVTGTTVDGCSASASISIGTYSLPQVVISPSSAIVCVNSATSLTATGASIYSWNTGSSGSLVVVTPSATTSYSVTGTNGFGCTNTAVVAINTNTLPVLNITADNATVCANAVASMTANGALTYSWLPGNATGSIFSVTPTTGTTYTLLGAGTNSCVGSSTLSLVVSPCTGIGEWDLVEKRVRIYPNPTTGRIYTAFDFEGEKEILVLSPIGSLIFEIKTESMLESFDLSTYAKGLYYVRIKSVKGWSNYPVVIE